jgi:hypothetical protein
MTKLLPINTKIAFGLYLKKMISGKDKEFMLTVPAETKHRNVIFLPHFVKIFKTRFLIVNFEL